MRAPHPEETAEPRTAARTTATFTKNVVIQK